MKEIELESLMATYKASLGTCTRRPAARRARFPRGLALVGIGSVALAIAVFAWPRNAAATTIHRIAGAIRNAKTMEAEFSMQSASGQWRIVGETAMRDGMYRAIWNPGTPLELRLIQRDGMALLDYQQLEHATLAPADSEESPISDSDSMNALEFVEKSIDMGRAGQPRNVQILEHASVGQIPTYLVMLDRPLDSYHAEILVDRRTDLPISAEVSVQGGKRMLRYRNVYHFNRPLAEVQFAQSSEKPVVNLRQAQEDLAVAWTKTAQHVGEPWVHEASITPDGTIWIAVSEEKNKKPVVLPTTITTPDGGLYARGQDVAPSAMVPSSHRFTVQDRDCYVAMFVPLVPNRQLPASVTIQFVRRYPFLAGYSQPMGPTFESVDTTATMKLKVETSERPTYFPALDLDYFAMQVPMTVWDIRAHSLAKVGRDVEAARAYEQEAVAYQNFVASQGSVPLTEAAHCYQAAGETAKAAIDLERANRLKSQR